MITQHYEIYKHYEAIYKWNFIKKNTENNAPKKTFAMTYFNL